VTEKEGYVVYGVEKEGRIISAAYENREDAKSYSLTVEGAEVVELVNSGKVDDAVEEALEQFVAWLDDSLNGIRGEVEDLQELADEEQPQHLQLDVSESAEQLEWKTGNLIQEAEDVVKEISEDVGQGTGGENPE
jgi:DNA-binding PadR family transcriptional regulator